MATTSETADINARIRDHLETLRGWYTRKRYRGRTKKAAIVMESMGNSLCAAIVSIPENAEIPMYDDDDLKICEIHEWCGHNHDLNSGRVEGCLSGLERKI